MTKKRSGAKVWLWIGGIATVVCVFTITAFISAVTYKSRLHAAVLTLEAQYQQGLYKLPQSATTAQAVAVLQPFSQAKLPHLIALGPFGRTVLVYKQADELQTQADQMVSDGAAYYVAYQQLVSYFNQTNAVVAAHPNANTTSVSGWKATGAGYQAVADLRKRVVTSPLLSDATSQEVSTFDKIATLDSQEAAAMSRGDSATEASVRTQLAALANKLSAIGLVDVPRGFPGWRVGLPTEFNELVSSSQ